MKTKMMQLMLLPILCLFSMQALRGQDNVQHRVGIDLGFGNYKKQDLIFSPFIHEAWSPMNTRINYSRSGKLVHRARLRFGQYKPGQGDLFVYELEGNTYEKLLHQFILVDLNYALGKQIPVNPKLNYTLGGRYRNRLQISNYDYAAAGSFGYLTPIGIDAWMGLEYEPAEKHVFSLNLFVPLFSYVARSPYMGQDDNYLERISVHSDLAIFWEQIKSGKIQTWGTSNMADLEFDYSYVLSKRWDLKASYFFSINHHTDPVKHIAREHTLFLGANFKF